MFKVNNTVSIFNFEHVNADWDYGTFGENS